jgi:Calx-beta domain-containing protein
MSHRRLSLAGLALTLALAHSAQAATPPPEVHLPNLQIKEGDAAGAPLTINVALDRPNPYAVPVSVIVHDYTPIVVRNSTPPRTYGTATPGSDYAPVAQFRLEWAPGQQIATFPVTLLGDTLDEADENVNLRISGPSGVQIRDNDIDIVLRDNDPLGTTSPLSPPLLLLPNATLSEPDAGCPAYEVAIQLARPAPGPVSVLVGDYTSVVVRGSNPPRTYGDATPGVDYLPFAPFRLSFAAGASSATFPIRICGDTAPEGDEEIDVRVSAPAGVSIADNDLDLILRDEDA